MDMFSFGAGMQPKPGQLQAFWASVAASDSQAPRKADGAPALPAMSVDFIMFDYKTVHCPRKYGHDWSLCPCAHPNEKTKRRSPRTYNYASVICPEMKELNFCPRGDSCNMSHSVYEFWLHPSRYHTELCRMGARCNRKICFFAHNQAELRMPQELPVGAQIIPAAQFIPNGIQAMSAGPTPPASAVAPPAAASAVGAQVIPSIQAISTGPVDPTGTAAPAAPPAAAPAAAPAAPVVVVSEGPPTDETATAPTAAEQQLAAPVQDCASTPVVLQAPVQAPVLKVVSTAGLCLQDGPSSNASEGTPCAASGSGPSSLAPSAADTTGSTSTSTPTAQAQPKPQVQHTSAYVPDFGPANRQQRRQFVHRQPVYSTAPPAAASVLAPAALQGLLANIGSTPVNLNQGVSLSALAQLRSQMAGLGVSAATAAMYASPIVSSGPQMAHGWHNGMGVSQGFTYSQPTGGLLQVPQQQPMPQPSFGGQPSLFGSSNPGMAGADMLLQQQQGGMPGVLGLGGGFADGGFNMAPAGQFPPGIVYQQVPADAGGFGAVGSSLQPMSMQQVMLMPGQIGAQPGGSQALNVPMPAGNAGLALQGSLFGFP